MGEEKCHWCGFELKRGVGSGCLAESEPGSKPCCESLLCGRMAEINERLDAIQSPTPQLSFTDIATDIWASAQLMTGEGIADGVARVKAALKEHFGK